MSRHLQREIENLKKEMLRLGASVEGTVRDAARSLEERDSELARRVIQADVEIDNAEVKVEEDCLKILALHQPVAIDLRFIVAVLKINNDLERIGDLAVNIAERSVFLSTKSALDIDFDFVDMARQAQSMLTDSLDALVNLSPKLAHEVRMRDDVVDEMNREVYIKVRDAIKENPDNMESLVHLLSVSRHLERIADCATNIAEDVIYMIDGEIVRHKTENYG